MRIWKLLIEVIFFCMKRLITSYNFAGILGCFQENCCPITELHTQVGIGMEFLRKF
jgi:hypothetical protein